MTFQAFPVDDDLYEVEAWCDGADVDIDTVEIRHADGTLVKSTYADLIAALSVYRDESIEDTMEYIQNRFLDRWADDRINVGRDYW